MTPHISTLFTTLSNSHNHVSTKIKLSNNRAPISSLDLLQPTSLLPTLQNLNHNLLPRIELDTTRPKATPNLDRGRCIRVRLARHARIPIQVGDEPIGELAAEGEGRVVDGDFALDSELGESVELYAHSSGEGRGTGEGGEEGEHESAGWEVHVVGLVGGFAGCSKSREMWCAILVRIV